MKPGPRPRTTKFVPPEVIDEMVIKSSQYLYELLVTLDRLVAEETEAKRKDSLKTIKDLLLKERANFRLLSKQISPDVDYVFANVTSDVRKKTRDPLQSLAERMTPHLCDDLQGWSIYVGNPGGNVLHLSYVDLKKANNANDARRFALTAVVTLFQHPAEPDKVFVNVVYLNESNGQQQQQPAEGQLAKDERMMFRADEISAAIVPLLKSVEGKAYFNYVATSPAVGTTESSTTSSSSPAASQPRHYEETTEKINEATADDGHAGVGVAVKRERRGEETDEDEERVGEDAAAKPEEARADASGQAVAETRRKRKSKFSQEFLREALHDSDVEDEEEMDLREKRRSRKQNWSEPDADFSVDDVVEWERHAMKGKRYREETEAADDEWEDVYIGDCRLCRVSLTLYSGANHAERCHADQVTELFKCPVCGKETPSVLFHLKRYHHPNRFECDVCNRPFLSQFYMKKHRRAVHFPEEGEFACGGPKGCGRGFDNEKERDDHIAERHRSDNRKRMPCYVCGKSYDTRAKLHLHLANVHQAVEKTFACPKCPKKFGAAKSLMGHLVVHDRKLTFVCNVCGKAFARKGNLAQHMISHRPAKHPCEVCGKMFLYRAGVRTHLKQVHGVETSKNIPTLATTDVEREEAVL